MSVIKEPHKIKREDGSVTVYLGLVEFKVGPTSGPQPAKER